MTTVNFELPEGALGALRLAPEQYAPAIRLAAAIHWYSRGEISQERAAEVAGLNRRDFILALAREKVDVFHVEMDDLKRELELDLG